uniref:Peptidylprolyl isomerase n=1 Tax=Grammatophora oceanica TaxID=210454 RepID=A0A7S1UYI4_9STRA|mmetsp:Transcript_2949/g.4045  ORF Transcript_2949/g.4045 Transcript_2949/m.4045 type:complete len:225 (+) Transcript_2949:81-755(+)
MINQDMRLFLRISYLLAMASAMPMQVNVNQRATECLYEKVDAGEAVTMSVFLLSGSELKATVYIEGPIAPPGVNSGLELQTSINEYNTGQRFGQVVKEQFVVDMEHLQATPEAEEIKDDDDAFKYDDDDDDDDATEKSEQDLEKARKRMEEKRRRAQIARQKAREMRRKREQQRKERAAKIREEGEPVQKTITAKTDGWYRACIMGSWFQVSVRPCRPRFSRAF